MSEPFSVGLNLISSSCGLWLAYLAVQIISQGLLGVVSQFHQILALLWVGSRNPIPPCSFGLQIVDHLTRAHLRLVPLDPHRKFHCRALIFWRTHFGTARIEERYRGIACSTALIRTNLLAMFRVLRVHEERRDSIFSRSPCQEACFRADSIKGAPK